MLDIPARLREVIRPVDAAPVWGRGVNCFWRNDVGSRQIPTTSGVPQYLSSRLRRVFLSGSRDRSYPPEQEEVVAAQLAPERQKQPVDRPLEGVPGAHAAKFYRPAIRAVAGEHA